MPVSVAETQGHADRSELSIKSKKSYQHQAHQIKPIVELRAVSAKDERLYKANTNSEYILQHILLANVFVTEGIRRPWIRSRL